MANVGKAMFAVILSMFVASMLEPVSPSSEHDEKIRGLLAGLMRRLKHSGDSKTTDNSKPRPIFSILSNDPSKNNAIEVAAESPPREESTSAGSEAADVVCTNGTTAVDANGTTICSRVSPSNTSQANTSQDGAAASALRSDSQEVAGDNAVENTSFEKLLGQYRQQAQKELADSKNNTSETTDDSNADKTKQTDSLITADGETTHQLKKVPTLEELLAEMAEQQSALAADETEAPQTGSDLGILASAGSVGNSGASAAEASAGDPVTSQGEEFSQQEAVLATSDQTVPDPGAFPETASDQAVAQPGAVLATSDQTVAQTGAEDKTFDETANVDVTGSNEAPPENVLQPNDQTAPAATAPNIQNITASQSETAEEKVAELIGSLVNRIENNQSVSEQTLDNNSERSETPPTSSTSNNQSTSVDENSSRQQNKKQLSAWDKLYKMLTYKHVGKKLISDILSDIENTDGKTSARPNTDTGNVTNESLVNGTDGNRAPMADGTLINSNDSDSTSGLLEKPSSDGQNGTVDSLVSGNDSGVFASNSDVIQNDTAKAVVVDDTLVAASATPTDIGDRVSAANGADSYSNQPETNKQSISTNVTSEFASGSNSSAATVSVATGNDSVATGDNGGSIATSIEGNHTTEVGDNVTSTVNTTFQPSDKSIHDAIEDSSPSNDGQVNGNFLAKEIISPRTLSSYPVTPTAEDMKSEILQINWLPMNSDNMLHDLFPMILAVSAAVVLIIVAYVMVKTCRRIRRVKRRKKHSNSTSASSRKPAGARNQKLTDDELNVYDWGRHKKS
ncbi:uncharacterized protein LOC141914032 isoform X2 [Tubulanus polymorphus]|uniref:uncharacterized protein LOC141914032 isoform X2 n=1 Tax=Tubulanus polymorphus TaxID=672921 RepID=UPI003DA259EE